MLPAAERDGRPNGPEDGGFRGKPPLSEMMIETGLNGENQSVEVFKLIPSFIINHTRKKENSQVRFCRPDPPKNCKTPHLATLRRATVHP